MKAKLLAASVLLSTLALPLRAENARLPYVILYQMEKIQGDLAHDYTNLLVVLRMTPTTPGVKTSDVQVYIDSKTGKIPVKVGSNGDFNVPMNDHLLAEQPWLITNQPKGAMQLDWGVALADEAVANPTHYRLLMKPVKDREHVEERMREIFSSSSKIKITGMKIIFPVTAQNASAVIHARAGAQKINANAIGQLTIPLNPAWLDEDPEITFSTSPDRQELSSD